MYITIFGNPDLPQDNLPIQILPELKKIFPQAKFAHLDPYEFDLPPANPWIIIDTVQGLKQVSLLKPEQISPTASRTTLHDFDLTWQLQLIQKVKKNIAIHIIGIPMGYNQNKALQEVVTILSTLLSKNEKRNSYTDHKLG